MCSRISIDPAILAAVGHRFIERIKKKKKKKKKWWCTGLRRRVRRPETRYFFFGGGGGGGVGEWVKASAFFQVVNLTMSSSQLMNWEIRGDWNAAKACQNQDSILVFCGFIGSYFDCLNLSSSSTPLNGILSHQLDFSSPQALFSHINLFVSVFTLKFINPCYPFFFCHFVTKNVFVTELVFSL